MKKTLKGLSGLALLFLLAPIVLVTIVLAKVLSALGTLVELGFRLSDRLINSMG